jgi:subtilisin family serine protease
MSNIINSYRGKGIKYLEWYGQQVSTYYGPIVNYLESINLIEEAHIFSSPQIMENAVENELYIIWSSSKFTKGVTSILALTETEKAVALKRLDEHLRILDECANKLLADEKFDKVKFGQLLKKAIQYPDHSFIFYENDKILLTGWGLVLVNEDNKGLLSLSTIIDNKTIENNDGEQNNDEDKNGEDPLKENESDKDYDYKHRENISQASSNIEKDDSLSSEVNTDKTLENDQNESESQPESVQNESNTKRDNGTEPDVRPSSNFDFSLWLKRFLIAALLILLAYILYYMFTKTDPIPTNPDIINETGNVEIPFEKIKEFDPGKIQPGPDQDSIFNIAGDRLNIAIIDKNKNIEIVEKLLKTKFDTTKFSIIYKNYITNRLQIEGDFTYLDKVKNEIKGMNTPEKILVWYERIFKTNKTFNDPYLNNADASWYLKEIQGFEAWDITQGDSSIVVAILDSGFDLGHDEFKGKIYKPFDVSKHSVLQTYTNKIGQHGTHVAALSIGAANNNSGLSGVAPKCKLMPVKVGNDNGVLASSYIIDGILYAIKNGAHVINISIGADLRLLSSLKPPLHVQEQIANNTAIDEGEFWNELFKIAETENVTIVLAAGNDNVLAKIDPMKRSSNVIIVGASNDKNEIAEFSNYGQIVSITAPGTKILSATNGNTYEVLEGTSMAAPLVAGACALMKSIKPDLTATEMVEFFRNSGKVCHSGNQPLGPVIQINNALKQIKK